MSVNPGKGPNEENLKAILARTGYTLDVTTGQRKYGGPPPKWEGPPPGPGCEVTVRFLINALIFFKIIFLFLLNS